MNDYIEYALVEVDPDYLDVVEAVHRALTCCNRTQRRHQTKRECMACRRSGGSNPLSFTPEVFTFQ